jgi:hypothetical protein
MKWENLQGDEKRRYCEHCRLHVHNLSAMTPQEKRAVVSSDQGHTCITYSVQPETMMVHPRAWLGMSTSRAMYWVAAMVVAASSLFVAGCTPRRTMGKMCPIPPEHDEKKESASHKTADPS